MLGSIGRYIRRGYNGAIEYSKDLYYGAKHYLVDIPIEYIKRKIFKPKPYPKEGESVPIEQRPIEDGLWCPFATITDFRMNTQGFYPKKYPQGAIVHFTAGWDRDERDALNSQKYGAEQGYGFFMIGPTGKIYQSATLNRYAWHAGESKWPGLGSNVSRYLVGIEIANAGTLTKKGDKFVSWFGNEYLEQQVRYSKGTDEHPAGYYRKYTPEQEASLIKLLLWLKKNNPDVFSFDYVLGHSEVSGMKGLGRWRKSDPGAALSVSMAELRNMLKREYETNNSMVL